MNLDVQLLFLIDSPLNLCPIYPKFLLALAKLSEQMHKKFEENRTIIKGICQSERKAAEMISYRKMPLARRSEVTVMHALQNSHKYLYVSISSNFPIQ